MTSGVAQIVNRADELDIRELMQGLGRAATAAAARSAWASV